MAAICGIDWAAAWHDVLIADSASGEPLAERRFDHTEAGIAALTSLLVGCQVQCVAIERPEGVLVGRLLDAGICVLTIHPNRWACDKRLRAHVGVLSDSTRKWHPWAGEVYRRALARGQDHPHACRTLGRAWMLVLWRCRHDKVPYDPYRHGNLRRLQNPGG